MNGYIKINRNYLEQVDKLSLKEKEIFFTILLNTDTRNSICFLDKKDLSKESLTILTHVRNYLRNLEREGFIKFVDKKIVIKDIGRFINFEEDKEEIIKETKEVGKEIQDVINKFNERASKEFSRVEYQTNSIILAIEDRLKEDSFDMDKILEKINHSDFLRGKGSGGWTADFEWILKKDNYLKILNGKYDSKNKIDKFKGERRDLYANL